MPSPASNAVDAGWKGMYKAGGVSAIIVAVLTIAYIPFLLVVGSSALPPSTGAQVIMAISGNKLSYLTFVGLYALSNVLFIPTLFALYLALKEVNKTYMLIATGLGGVSTIFFVLGPAVSFSLAGLSDSYASATGVQQAALLASAELAERLIQVLAIIAGLTFAVYALIIGLVMLRGVFSKWIAYIGIVLGILSLEPYPSLPALGALGVFIPPAGFILLIIWLAAVGYKLYKLG